MEGINSLRGTLGATQARDCDVAEKRAYQAEACETAAIQKSTPIMSACRSLEELQARMAHIQDRLVNFAVKIGASIPPTGTSDKEKPERSGLVGYLDKTAADAHQRCGHIETVLRAIENTF
jgi:hypothetical protein